MGGVSALIYMKFAYQRGVAGDLICVAMTLVTHGVRM